MNRIQAKVNDLMQVAAIKWPAVQFPQITVKMNARLRTTAGRAYLQQGIVEFNPSIYEAHVEEFLEDTVPHEVAHVVAYYVFGSTGHDIFWKQVCSDLGSATQRLHSFTVPKCSNAKTYKFKCACMEHEFTPQRYAWVKKGKMYRCRNCGEILVEVK